MTPHLPEKMSSSVTEVPLTGPLLENFLDACIERGFGMLSKREVERLLFALMVDADKFPSLDDYFYISRQLKITPAKAANLVYEYRLTRSPRPEEFRNAFANLLRKTSVVTKSNSSSKLALEVRDRLLREELEEQIHRLGLSAPDYTFNRNLLILDFMTLASLVEKFAEPQTMATIESELKARKDFTSNLPTPKELLAKFLEKAAEGAGSEAGVRIVDLADLLVTGGIGKIGLLMKRVLGA
jgi:hypothetical protein